jgi:hypothetical protein
MITNRRMLLTGAAALAAAPLVTSVARAQTPPAPLTQAVIQQRLVDTAKQNLYPMAFDGSRFSGPGWDFLQKESAAAEFVLFGEEHGMAETPLLAKELFLSLRPHGFDTLAIEISPPIAQDLDMAARKGVEGIESFVRANYPGPAFYNWKTEAELIAAVRASVPLKRDVLWGLDYEVGCDRQLIKRLWNKAGRQKNALGSSLTKLDTASQDAWKAWRETKDPSKLFTFSGDPQLVRDIRAAWKKPDADLESVLATLEETLEINKLWVENKGYASNERRSGNIRKNFVAHLNRAAAEGRKPKAMIKMGESHVMRGLNWTAGYDVGSLVHEVATLRGGKAFALCCGGGIGSHHGITDPTVFSTQDAPVDMFEEMGLGFLANAVTQPGPMVIDARPLRARIAGPTTFAALASPEAAKVIFSFDAVVVWNGSTATRQLVPA